MMQILIIASLFAFALSQQTCPANEEFNTCGSSCPVTCNNLNQTITCTMQCVQGCVCKSGYVRNSNGTCVLTRDCPNARPICLRANEEYKECGTACPATCDNYNNSRICTMQCVQGCFCKNGYVRNVDGSCVMTRDCPNSQQTCAANEVYSECGSACPATCDNYNDVDRACIAMCVTGCFCQEGYVRNSSGICVMTRDCNAHQTCAANEEWNECGTACPITCANHNNPPTICTDQCVIGCTCRSGYVRSRIGGPCVLTRDCTAQA